MLTEIAQSTNSGGSTQQDKLVHGQTADFGIQVDMNQNPQNLQNMLRCDQNQQSLDQKSGLSQTQRRKQKKKLYKRKRKQKTQQMQRQARRQIGNIIQQFYERTSNFQSYSHKIQLLVQQIYNNDFRQYLDQLIRMRVGYIQKSIWEYTQSILYQNPFQRNDDHVFYSQMVDQIYQRFLEIQESSKQIQKIINIYLKFAYHKNQSKQEIIYNNLAVNTFNYMIETDQTLKNLLHICDKKINQNKKEHRRKLQELISIIQNYYPVEQEDEEEYANCPNDDQSTGYSEEDDLLQLKKKRRRKVKDSDLTVDEQLLNQRLDRMQIRDYERSACRLSEQWLKKMELKGLKYRNVQRMMKK